MTDTATGCANLTGTPLAGLPADPNAQALAGRVTSDTDRPPAFTVSAFNSSI